MGQYCETALCYPKCMNGGNCTAPAFCSCPKGYQGTHCEGGNTLFYDLLIFISFFSYFYIYIFIHSTVNILGNLLCLKIISQILNTHLNLDFIVIWQYYYEF